MHWLAQYGLFLAKTTTLVIAVLILLVGSIMIAGKNKIKSKGKIKIKHLNKKYAAMRDIINQTILDKQHYKKFVKTTQQNEKTDKKDRKKVFVLNFQGDLRAQASSALREEITAVLMSAKSDDEIVLNLESAGGLVHAYGLAASQLQRIKQAKIPLTICIDKVAASGGYMMACVADQILAAPFAVIGSIGVLAQIPNFHRFLEQHNIDFEQLSAGAYKRTLTFFGKNTDEGRQKLQQEIEETHELFKNFISLHRPNLDVSKVATGEYWYGTKALSLNLIDGIKTSDDYLLNLSNNCDVYEIKYQNKKSLSDKLFGNMQKAYRAFNSTLQEQHNENQFL